MKIKDNSLTRTVILTLAVNINLTLLAFVQQCEASGQQSVISIFGMTTATNALGQRVFQNRYDPAGNLTNRIDNADNAVNYRYDALDRLVSRSAESA